MKGPKGGLYVMVGATKKYGAKPSLKPSPRRSPSPPKKSPSPVKSPSPHGRNSKGRKIMKGPRGGLYVMVGATKKYGAKPTTK
jgi:glucose/arabinose dehydrogenase